MSQLLLNENSNIAHQARFNLISAIFVVCILSRVLQMRAIIAIAIGLCIVYVVVKNIGVLRIISIPIYAAFLLTMIILTVFATLFSPYPINTVNSLLEVMLWLEFILFGFSIAICYPREYMIDGIIRISNWILVFAILGLFMQYALGIRFATDTVWGDSNSYAVFQTVQMKNPFSERMRSVFSHPIIFADVILVALASQLFLEKHNRFALIKTTILLIALVLTGTRGAWLTLAILVFAFLLKNQFFIFSNKWNIVLLAIFTSLAAFIVFNSVGLIDMVINRLSMISVDSSYYNRSFAINYILELLSNDIVRGFFGYGNGSSDIAISRVHFYLDGWNTVDNQWIATLFDSGFVSFILLATTCLYCIVEGFKTLDKLACMLAFGVVLPGVIDMLFYNMFNWSVTSYLFFLAIGWIILMDSTKFDGAVSEDDIITSATDEQMSKQIHESVN